MNPTIISPLTHNFDKQKSFWKEHLYLILLLVISVLIAFLILKPLWTILGLHVPGEPFNRIDFTDPVDSIFYIRNSQWGYRWQTPTSIWFHPLLSEFISLLPKTVPANYRLWVISLFFGLASSALLIEYIRGISSLPVSRMTVLLIPILPGGLGIATGNAEFICLFFALALALSLLRKWPPIISLALGGLAILSKPNASYMVPFISVYLVQGILERNNNLVQKCVFGLGGILLFWFLWISIVDINSGSIGTYWNTRNYASTPLTIGPLSFLYRSTMAVFETSDPGYKLKFFTALAIPLVDLWVMLLVPLKDETHRIAILFGILSMIVITFVINNPNKMIVYSTTFPGHFAVGLLFLKQTLGTPRLMHESNVSKAVRLLAGVSYLGFCFVMILFFLFGTPFEWYY